MNLKLQLILTFYLTLPVFLSVAQDINEGFKHSHQIKINKSNAAIVVDGLLDEQSWKDAECATDFSISYPRDSEKAYRRTEVRATYDDGFIYIGAICYETSEYIVQTLKRDSRFWDGDAFGVVLDPVNRQSNGFLFGVSPLNVQSEDLISSSAFGDLNFSWDNKWYSEVTRYPDKWIVEMAIPFKTLRFEDGGDTWGINFIRNDLKRNEYYSWTPVPVNFFFYDLGYMGSLVWDKAPKKTGRNISLIPYISGAMTQNNEESPTENDAVMDWGMDAKVALTSSLNLDLTYNPDFSQVDVDVQQTNLTRFNLQFPERRAFFLENNDLFTNYGTPPARPIFSRSIGLDADASPIPILYGARLSGNIGDNSRIGLLNLQTQSGDSLEAQNYSIFTINQSVFKRSLVKAYATNRQSFSSSEGLIGTDFGRNTGLELNFRNQAGTWNPWVALHLSDKSEVGTGTFGNIGIRYNGRNLTYFIDYIALDTDYYADMGFLQRIENEDALTGSILRLGSNHIFQNLAYTIRPKEKKVIAHEYSVRSLTVFNPDNSLNERNTSLRYAAQFRSTANFNAQIENSDVRLLVWTGFNADSPLPPVGYQFTQIGAGYSSDQRKSLAFEVNVQAGSFYVGSRNRYFAAVTYRAQPWGNFSLAFEQNTVDFGNTYGKNQLYLINQRTEINLSNQLFWTTFLQFNTQANNFNINSRIQWRYLPMSDVFIVYSDNYFSDPLFKNKNRALVFKATYWFTL